MKANAPEKIYLHPSVKDGEYNRYWLIRKFNQNSVEYTRTDAFIKKADKFISTFFHPDDTELINAVLKEFHEYIKGS